MLLYKIAAFLVNFLLHVPLLPEIPSSDILSLYNRTVRSLRPCSPALPAQMPLSMPSIEMEI